MTDNKEKLIEIINNMMWIGDPVSHINEACDTMIYHWFPTFTEMDKKLFKYDCVKDAVDKGMGHIDKGYDYIEWMDKLGSDL